MESSTLKRAAFAFIATGLALLLLILCSPDQCTKNHILETSLETTHMIIQKDEMPLNTEIPLNKPEKEDTDAPYTVIFDLNGVLFQIDKKKALSHLGFMNMVSYTASGKGLDDLELKMFDMLHRLTNNTLKNAQSDDTLVPLHNGSPLPSIMCKWLEGTVSSEEIIAKLEPLIEKLDKEHYFTSAVEKRILKKISSLMFDPKIRAQVYVPLKKGLNLLKQCVQAGNKVYLLSNMDSALIKELQETHPTIFDLFNGIIVSADVNMIKPYKDIYLHTLKTYNLNPKKCCFIDDQIENVMGAKKVGLKAFQFSDEVAQNIQSEFIKQGIFHKKG